MTLPLLTIFANLVLLPKFKKPYYALGKYFIKYIYNFQSDLQGSDLRVHSTTLGDLMQFSNTCIT